MKTTLIFDGQALGMVTACLTSMRNNLGMRQNGFTLIEILIVVAIIGVLAAIALPQVQRFADRSKRTEGFLYAKSIHLTQLSYFAGEDSFAVGDWPSVHLKLGISTEIDRVNKFYTQFEAGDYLGKCRSGGTPPARLRSRLLAIAP